MISRYDVDLDALPGYAVPSQARIKVGATDALSRSEQCHPAWIRTYLARIEREVVGCPTDA
jgi:hypothetical protein